MDFGILGPLEVRDRGRPVPVSGAKQRTLLALLLLEANRVVTRDRLVDALWAGEPPDTATKALQVHVSQLRKAIGARRIVTRGAGYALEVDRDRLDLERFERLAAAGRQALATGDAAAAAATLAEALELWYGPPLADLAEEPALRPELERLDELRLAALEDRIDADLALARHGELAGELEALVSEHPLRERLRGQLMVALYRAGRQAEALEAYQEGRRTLVDELGIDPSPALQRLEQAILRQDPALEVSPAERSAQGEPAPERGQRKLATVLFADLVDSTGHGEDDPERVHVLLGRFFETMATEIELAGGTVEKFIGDAVVAAFGAPASQEDHAERALHTALSMRTRLAELFAGRLELRIGVNTGEVAVGLPRAGGSFVTGDAVNVAKRLEQAAATGEVLVGERTVAAAGDAFEFGPRATLAVKGKSDGVACRPLLRAVATTRSRGVRGLHSSFVGRSRELELLSATYRRAVQEAEPHLVTVIGDAGVGKTRLLQELWRHLEAEAPAPLTRAGRCLAYGRGITYAPLAEILRAQLGLLESDSAEDARRRLGDREILALTLGLEPDLDLHPLVARERLHEAWVGLLEELVAERPVVVVVEDLHWAEEPLLELLARLQRDVRGPLLLLASARPELLADRPAWSPGRRNSSLLWLEPLARDEAGRLLDELLAAEPPAQLRDLVLSHAEGNPFFLEEVLATLIDQGALERGLGGWSFLPLADGFSIPDTVRAALAARIDLLPPREKAALQAASVIGRVFWEGPIAELRAEAEPDFRLLEDRDFIRRRPDSALAGEREYAFKHALTREVAYSTLTKAERARLHAGFAAWLERVGEGRDEDAPLLAHHYAEAARPEDADLAWGGDEAGAERLRAAARRWLQRAAELAVGRYALSEGVALLHRALELEPPRNEQAELWWRLGRMHALGYDAEPFRAAMERAISLCDEPEVRAEMHSELAFQTGLRIGMWKQAPAPEVVEAWIARALAESRPGSAARARALAAGHGFQPIEAEADEAFAIAEALGDVELRSFTRMAQIEVALADGSYERAVDLADDRLVLLERIRDPDHRVDMYWSATLANLGLGRIAAATRFADSHASVAAELTPHHVVHGAGLSLVVAELAGSWRQIVQRAAPTEQAVGANTATPCMLNPRSLLVCALAHAQLGDQSEGARLEDAANDIGLEGYGLSIDAPRLQLALVRDDLETAERLLEAGGLTMTLGRLAALAARLDALVALGRRKHVEAEAAPLLRPATYLEPFALRALGLVREDEELIRRAVERFQALGLDWHAEQTRARIG